MHVYGCDALMTDFSGEVFSPFFQSTKGADHDLHANPPTSENVSKHNEVPSDKNKLAETMTNCAEISVTKTNEAIATSDYCLEDRQDSNEDAKCKIAIESCTSAEVSHITSNCLEYGTEANFVTQVQYYTTCKTLGEIEFVSKYFNNEDIKSCDLKNASVFIEEFDSVKHGNKDLKKITDEEDKFDHLDVSFSSESSEEEYDDRELRLSQIDCAPSEIFVENFFNMTPRSMPESPHRIIEEQFKNNPWVMLVATIFLTKTTGLAAKPIMKKFFSDFPTPHEVITTNPVELEVYFRTLGMRKRGVMIWRMSYQFISAKWRRASDLHGIGKYGEDAYRLFCLGHTDVEPTDRYLRLYVDWLISHTDHQENWSISDCEGRISDPVAKYYAITLR